MDRQENSIRHEPIAIVGMAARFPGAATIAEFWNNLVGEKETIQTLSEDILRRNEIDYDALKSDPDYVPRAGILEGVENWDADFFGLTPRQAALMDPQHKQWLECAWDALEDGCLDPTRFQGNIGVFTGIGTRGNYLMANIARDRAYLDTFVRNGDVDVYETQLLNDRDYIASRTGQVFGLTGPTVTMQGACATSLMGVALACQSIWSGNADAAIVGGSSIQFPQARGYLHQPGGIFSKDGSTRSFDAAANGTIFSCGVGAVLLQPMKDAMADKRPVYAVIRGAATNNDGGTGVSYIAPSVKGQIAVIKAAMRQAQFNPRTMSYIEAHGTATQLGDPVEVHALTNVYRGHTSDKGFCGLGSVKSNIGHTSSAAGVAGLIKAALSIHHRTLPASLHFLSPNPKLELSQSPFNVIDSTRPWVANDPLRAGVSAFGVGGVNAHVVLEEVI